MRQPYLQPVEDPSRVAGAGGGNGNGGLVGHRLSELERRVGALGGKVDELAAKCTRIEAKLDEVATKSDVWKIFGGTAVVLTLSIMGHLFIRTLASG